VLSLANIFKHRSANSPKQRRMSVCPYLLIPADFIFEQSLEGGSFAFARFKRSHFCCCFVAVVIIVVLLCNVVVVAVVVVDHQDSRCGGGKDGPRFASKLRQDGKFSRRPIKQECSRFQRYRVIRLPAAEYKYRRLVGQHTHFDCAF
jgi:hypothetical protein